MTTKLKELLAEYGAIGIIVYFVIFFLVWSGFAIAIRSGFAPTGVSAQAGVIGAAWLATKLTQPLRIGVTLLLTPFIVKAYQRTKKSLL